MEKKYSLTLDKEFIQYCNLNNIEDVENFATKIFKKGFDLEKYGEKPEKIKYVKPIKEGTTKGNMRNTEGKTRQAPPPPPHPSKRIANERGETVKSQKKDNLYDE